MRSSHPRASTLEDRSSKFDGVKNYLKTHFEAARERAKNVNDSQHGCRTPVDVVAVKVEKELDAGDAEAT